MIDISAVGSKVVITPYKGTAITITQFSDEGTPFDAPDVEVSQNEKNLNGTMISSRKVSVYPVSITVVPGTDDDFELQKLLQKSATFPGNSVSGGSSNNANELFIKSLQLWVPGVAYTGTSKNKLSANAGVGYTYSWSNGRIKSGPTGPSTSAEGRQASRTYTFEFEIFSPISGNANINS